MFNAVTKSGKTSETMAQMMTVAAMLKKAGLPVKDHIIATTDEKNGNLIRIAQEEGLKAFVIPADVGGRFSELTPVGLLPAAVCGFNIRAMLNGAADMDETCSKEGKNPASLFALLHVLAMKKGVNVSVMLPYADSLKYMADWYAQLWAESLGKRADVDGKEVFAGQTPVKALGVTDQHSQIQLFTEGPFDKLVTFLKVGKFRSDLGIPAAFEYVDDIAFLAGYTFGELLEAERSATEYALCKAGRMNITITLPEVSEYTVGALLHFFEMATAYAGELLHINAFDQPGVEEGKKATFALMGKAGFEAKKAEMDARREKDKNWILG
jgi:glucose-6-phosphate isomerase